MPGRLFSITAPTDAKITCVSARSVTTSGSPERKKPSVVPSETATATPGERNIAMKIGTWLASVNDAGPITIFGKKIGITIPTAISSAVSTVVCSLFSLLFSLSIIQHLLRRIVSLHVS